VTTRLVLDAHSLLWFLTGDRRLGAKAKDLLTNPAAQVSLPAIALAEACWAVERGRFAQLTAVDLLAAIRRDRRIRVIPLTGAIVRRTLSLEGIGEMHDRQIAATVLRIIDRQGAAVLLTKDANITASGLVPVVW
jgi:PIN domain nuclease of toxin-antitoxin system